MPKRTDLEKILIIGSGPIVIGQSCEFDYSGTQACKSLRQEGYEVVLVNSNPATIMTDPEMAPRTYIEPVTPEAVAKVIAAERPDALLPTLGGQTGLNTAVALAQSGVLDTYGVEMIGATLSVIQKAEARDQFKTAMGNIGLNVPASGVAHDLNEAHKVLEKVGLPCVIRPSFTLGGAGGGIAYNVDEFDAIVSHGISLSMTTEVLVEASVLGWKEYELEVMRDRADNVVIICSIENLDPMGVHTGDSITVAPAQTLSDKEYQVMRNAAIAVIREIGVETGGSNIQFAINPRNGEMIVIEMNPRVSRSSALASKATGFPIAKIAAKLAVGMTLDEIDNDITRETPACFEPAIDYCVVKTPRFAFEKFPGTDTTLMTQMKSVGETMSIGRTFKEALQKSIRSLEVGRFGLGYDGKDLWRSGAMPATDEIRKRLITPGAERLYYLRYAMLAGMDLDEIHDLTRIDKWFLHNIREIVRFESDLAGHNTLAALPTKTLLEAKRMGFSDRQIATALSCDEEAVRNRRKAEGVVPTYKLVDTCAAEFEAYTPYYYSTYETEDEARVSDRKKIMILGGGPNRIGQGIEFDYCCVHAAMALRELGYETIMVNSNPETVSTDYDTSDLLFFEPLTLEDVLAICDRMQPAGVIVQFGGQTPLNLAKGLRDAGVKIIGTSVDSIDRAEDRKKFKTLLNKLGLVQPDNDTATTVEQAIQIADQIGYPVVVRPSYVLGGRAMEIVSDQTSLERYMKVAVDVSPEHPILIDKFLEDAIEIDVDAVSDGNTVVVGGIMEHIEEAGIHSGDSCCVMPGYTISDALVRRIRECTHALAIELNVEGLMNIQFAIRNDVIYVLEVNPRASRTVPFVSKAIGVPLAKVAAKVMAGLSLEDIGLTEEVEMRQYAVKVPVFPFSKLPGSDIILGPEMKSTGEVMGIDNNFGLAFAKAQLAARQKIPTCGTVFISVRDMDKREIIFIAKSLQNLGFTIIATHGTAKVLERNGVIVETVRKIHEGRPSVSDLMRNGSISLIINTPSGREAREDEKKIRSLSVSLDIPCLTTLSAASAFVTAVEALGRSGYSVKALQDYHPEPVLKPKKTEATAGQ